jgi:ketosteroid isomerase-like protein
MTNVDVVARAYRAYAAGDVPAMFALLDPDVEIVQTALLPWGGVHRGHDGARHFFGMIGALTATLPQPDHLIPAGDDVVAVGRLRGHARATGRPIDLAIAHVLTLRDGRIVRFAPYIDTPAMLAALAPTP